MKYLNKMALFSALVAAFFSGCAWFSDSPNQIVRIEASDGAKLVATITSHMKNGTFGFSNNTKTFKTTLPTEVPIGRANGAKIAILESDNPGYQNTELVIEGKAGINPWYFGNIITGGYVGTTTTDPISGSMWKYGNPNFVVPVKKK